VVYFNNTGFSVSKCTAGELLITAGDQKRKILDIYYQNIPQLQ